MDILQFVFHGNPPLATLSPAIIHRDPAGSSRMRKKPKQRRQALGFALFGLALTALFIVVVTNVGRQQELAAPQKLALEILGRVQAGLTGVTSHLTSFWQDYLAILETRQENERLRQDLAQARALTAEYREAVATNVRLAKLLDLKESLEDPSLTARVIGRDPSLWFRTIIIDRGASDGVQKGMPVVAPEGVVGQIMNASPHYAKVLLANDPNSAIDALVQRSRIQGMIKGREPNLLDLHYVLKSTDVQADDSVVTSGMGGIFPKGLPVGRVTRVVNNSAGMFQAIEVVPAVDFAGLEHVIIILKKNPLAE
ncbi:MAG: rod shape-determining protein MreC [Thermodesulfobacteriota bacterium]